MTTSELPLEGQERFEALYDRLQSVTSRLEGGANVLSEAVAASEGDVVRALERWEPGQLEVGRQVLERARDLGDRSQFLGTYRPPDPYLSFGLYRPGDSWMRESA